MYDRILLPTDGETGAETATSHAIDLAATVGADLHVCYVVDEDIYGAYSGDEFVHEHEGAEASLEDAGERALESVAEAADRAGVETTTELRYGVPYEEIVDYADDVAVDLIVIGTKSRSAEFRHLLGSVTERVSRITDRPVTIVKTEVD